MTVSRVNDAPELDRATTAHPSALLNDLTVVIVRDHLHPDGDDPDREVALCLEGLLAQPLAKETRIILAAGPQYHDTLRPLVAKFSAEGVRIELLPGGLHRSQDMKNHAYNQVATGWTWHLDSDCVPQPRCLNTLAAVAAARPELKVISARTTYGDNTPWQRVAAIVDRSAEEISMSAAVFRTELLTQYPISDSPPHTKGIRRAKDIVASGAGIHFETSAIVHHEFEGIGFFGEFWRTRGFAFMWLSGARSYRYVPRKLLGLLRRALQQLARFGPARLKPLDWVFVPPILIGSMYFALLGMRDCARGKDRADKTSFV